MNKTAHRVKFDNATNCDTLPVSCGNHARGRLSSTARALAFMLLASSAHAAPTGGQVSAGSGSIAQSGSLTTVNQQSRKLSVNWQSFSIAPGETVNFMQPSASAIALNRVLGSDPSQIYGRLQANGQVFLINSNGVLFGPGAQVDVAGLVASTLQLSDADFLEGNYRFQGAGGTVTNQGTINAANGGYVALLGKQAANEGVITARMGTVALAAGNQVTLDFSGNQLVNVQVSEAAVNALAQNRQLIQADGGMVILTAAAKDMLLDTVVNNTGIIEARTVENHNGVIRLLGAMNGGTVRVGGTLDASAPNGGDGGFIETSGAHVNVAEGARVSTAAPNGTAGTWLIDPQDYTIAASGGDISGATLGANLESGNVTILSSSGATAGNGDIFVNDNVSWSANTTLALLAERDINVNAVIAASGNSAGLTLTPATGGSGSYILGMGGRIDLPGSTPSLVIAGNTYSVINDVAALQNMSANLGGWYALGGNIDASATSGWNGGAGFVPVGNSTTPFTGTIDGLGHAVNALTINLPAASEVGLIGYSSGTLRNIGVQSGTVTGAGGVGGLVGTNDGAIINSYATVGVNGNSSVGGLVGSNGGTVGNSYATGSVSGTSRVGGLVGYNGNAVSNSYATGSVSGVDSVGGLAGSNNGTISNSYAAGSVSGTSYVGGIVGLNGGTVRNSHYDIDLVTINGGHYVTLGGLYHAQYQDWIGHGLALNIADYASTLRYDSASGYYLVGGVQGVKDLIGFADDTSYKFRLSSNVDLAPAPGFYIPSFRAQEFDGAGHVISNLSVNEPFSNNVGLFGWISNGSTIKNLGLTNVSVTGQNGVGALVGYADVNLATGVPGPGATVSNSYATGSVSGTFFVGGLVGINNGAVINSYATGSVSGSVYVGGLVGDSAFAVSNSYATGTVSGGTNSNHVGGLVGANSGTIGNSYATGNVSGTSNVGGLVGSNNGTISNSYATGSMSGSGSVGGLIGHNDYLAAVGNSFWNTTTSGQSTGVGTSDGTVTNVIGMTTTDMMTQANFTSATAANGNVNSNWDFAGVWGMYDGHTYPLLRSTLTPINVTANNDSKIYDGQAYSGGNGVTYSISSATLSGTVAYGGTSQGAVDAGSYSIAPSGLWSTTYWISYVNGTLTVNPAALTVTANDASNTYGQTVSFTGSEFGSSGLQNGETIGSATLTSAASGNGAGAGSYTIAPSAATGGTFNASNYTISYVNGTLTVNPAALTVTANDASKTYGQTVSFTGSEFSSSGLQNGETMGSATLTSAASGNGAGVGSYTIAPSAATGGTFNASNYTISYVNGTLTVIPAVPTVPAPREATVSSAHPDAYASALTSTAMVVSEGALSNPAGAVSGGLDRSGQLAGANGRGGEGARVVRSEARAFDRSRLAGTSTDASAQAPGASDSGEALLIRVIDGGIRMPGEL